MKTKIWHPNKTNIYPDASIGKGCNIACFVEIGKAVIGKNCKIGMGAFIPEGVTLEDDVFIAPNVVFTNDFYPRAKGEWEVKKTLIKKGASIGANSTILCGIIIGEKAMIGCGSVVTKDIRPRMVAVGNPARMVRKVKD